MKLLADENIDAALVLWLRDEGHDVVWAAEEASAASDHDLLVLAQRDSRVFLTNDRDFGELIFRQRLCASGVILLRLRGPTQESRLELLRRFWPAVQSRAPGHFIVVRNHRVRIRPMPIG